MFGKRLPNKDLWVYLFWGKIYVLGEKERGTREDTPRTA